MQVNLGNTLEAAVEMYSTSENPPPDLHQKCNGLLRQRGFIAQDELTMAGTPPKSFGKVSYWTLPNSKGNDACAFVLSAYSNDKDEVYSGTTYVSINPNNSLISSKLIDDIASLGLDEISTTGLFSPKTLKDLLLVDI